MRDLPIRIEVMPQCLCENKVIGYEYSEDGFNVTHCACGGVISCTESEGVEVKKPFDITKHEVSNHVTVLESGELGVFDSGWVIDKNTAIAIAKALGVTGEDLK
jgi:hypothetical protein